MRNPFRRLASEPSAAHEPRISGRDEPYYSVAAKDAFLNVLMQASRVLSPLEPKDGFADAAMELKAAVEVARLWCNDELARRMEALCEAAIEESMGGGSTEVTRAAREHFTTGCRLALGTND